MILIPRFCAPSGPSLAIALEMRGLPLFLCTGVAAFLPPRLPRQRAVVVRGTQIESHSVHGFLTSSFGFTLYVSDTHTEGFMPCFTATAVILYSPRLVGPPPVMALRGAEPKATVALRVDWSSRVCRMPSGRRPHNSVRTLSLVVINHT